MSRGVNSYSCVIIIIIFCLLVNYSVRKTLVEARMNPFIERSSKGWIDSEVEGEEEEEEVE